MHCIENGRDVLMDEFGNMLLDMGCEYKLEKQVSVTDKDTAYVYSRGKYAPYPCPRHIHC